MVPVNLCRCTDPIYPREIGAAFELSLSTEMCPTMLSLIGSAGAVVALGQLGRSFSMMAEARRLVTSGTYRFARHPISPSRSRSSECSYSLLAFLCTARVIPGIY
jgi:protein-S-isoprenylcysteine O-methyltransferase Ste14